MNTVTASQARAGLYRLIDQTAETHRPVVISGKRANAVLVSEEDWSAIQETLYLLAITGMRESIKDAIKDAKKLSAAGLKDKAQTLLEILELDPLQNPPPYEKLVDDLKGAYSSRINIQHRLVYEVIRKEKTVRILRMWTHYE